MNVKNKQERLFIHMAKKEPWLDDIIKDCSDPRIGSTIEVQWFGFFKAMSRSPLVELHEEPDMMRVVTGLPDPEMNGVYLARLNQTDINKRIEETLTYFKARRLPMTWYTGPATRPTDLGRHLEDHGLTKTSDTPGMAVAINELNEEFPIPQDFKIEPVRNEASIELFFQVARKGFGLQDQDSDFLQQAFSSIYKEKDLPLHLYLGLLGGVPVATSILLLGAGVACIHLVSTFPKVRRRGIGTRMTLAPLLEAQEIGYRVGVLHAGRMAVRMYQRLGFKEYCRLRGYSLAHTQSG